MYTTQYRYISYAKRTYMVTRRKAAEAKRIVLLAVLPVIRIASEIMKIMQITWSTCTKRWKRSTLFYMSHFRQPLSVVGGHKKVVFLGWSIAPPYKSDRFSSKLINTVIQWSHESMTLHCSYSFFHRRVREINSWHCLFMQNENKNLVL